MYLIMKYRLILFFMILSLQVTAQNKRFYLPSDSCAQVSTRIGRESVLILMLKNSCENYSVIQEVKLINGMYERNGSYTEFYDDNFKNIKQTGYFSKGMETGKWKLYYKNGKLKEKGSCKAIEVINPRKERSKLWIVDVETMDTVKVDFSFAALDSLKKLKQFEYYPASQTFGNMLPIFYKLRNGIWFYYSEKGTLIKKEKYFNGTLISN
jgi:antitoxin component YwqK of YwqJK toxin-antitoxin module